MTTWQVHLEEAEPLALVADGARVEAGADDDHLALLALRAARRREESLCALVEPLGTRWFITSGAIDFAAPWLEWIQARTEWLDQGTEAFLSSPSCAEGKQCQVVIIGAGFDTRSIRYQREGLRFFEVDLPGGH